LVNDWLIQIRVVCAIFCSIILFRVNNLRLRHCAFSYWFFCKCDASENAPSEAPAHTLATHCTFSPKG